MIIPIHLNENSYDVVVERNCLDKASSYLNLDRKVLIVSDTGVPQEYINRLTKQCNNFFILVLPQGEENKNFNNYQLILNKLCEESFNRHDCLIALAGGVIGDMAGFAASTYMRGIDFYNIPTTSLSQIDSSVGGKTGIDFEGYKNIVGSFYQPKKVLIDVNLLNTLDHRQLVNGLVEALKMGLIYDSNLVNYFKSDDYMNHLEEIIISSLNIKKYFVENDVKEANIRKALNFGHTVGHGLELNSSLIHGEAVGLGMLCMCNDDIQNELILIYKRLGLPISISLDKDLVINSISHDKKGNKDGIDCVLVDKIGTYSIEKKSLDDIRNLLAYAVKES